MPESFPSIVGVSDPNQSFLVLCKPDFSEGRYRQLYLMDAGTENWKEDFNLFILQCKQMVLLKMEAGSPNSI